MQFKQHRRDVVRLGVIVVIKQVTIKKNSLESQILKTFKKYFPNWEKPPSVDKEPINHFLF